MTKHIAFFLLRRLFMGCRLFLLGVVFIGIQASLMAQAPKILFKARDLSEEDVYSRIESLRNQRLAGDYCFKFEFVQIPRRGTETRYTGYLWGTWNKGGPLMRFYIPQSIANAEPLQILIQSGFNPEVWIMKQGQVRQLTNEELQQPLIQGAIVTAFDLQMPFVYWNQLEYEGSSKIKGREAYMIVAKPDSLSAVKGVEAARIIVDKNYNALMRIDILSKQDQEDQVLRTLDIQRLKKVENEWIIRCLDIISSNGDKTRFIVNEAALNLDLSPSFFNADNLQKIPTLPANDRFVYLP